MRRPYLSCFLLAAITLAVYWPVRHHDFIYYDDPQFITENEEVKAGLTTHGFVYALTQPVVGNWHPITTLSHMLDCQLFGVNPGAPHLMNAVIHAANAVLLFLVLSQMTGAQWRSAVVAALFALHPLRVESVAWISERKDVLCWFFGLLSLLAYLNFAKSTSARARTSNSQLPTPIFSGFGFFRAPAYWLALLFFALGLMSKAMLVTFPFVLLLLDVWPLRRVSNPSAICHLPSAKSLWLEKLPFLILSALFSAITLRVQQAAGAMSVIGSISLPDRLANTVMSYVKYLGKFFWPTDLAVVYPHPSAPYALAERWAGWQLVLAALGLLAISILCLRQFARRPYLAVGWFWFLGTLIPVIGLVQVGEQALADRYTYIPLVGLVCALVWWVAELASRFRWNRSLLGGFVVLLAGLLAALTSRQLQFWKDTISLFQHNLAVTAANPSAHFALGVGFERDDKIDLALAEYAKAVAIHPRYQKAHYNMGQIFRKQGQWSAAAASYQAVLAIDPNDVSSRLNFATVLNHLGQDAEAVLQFDEVLRRDPNSFEALNNLAWILATSPEPKVRDGVRAVALAEQACALTEHRLSFFVGTLAAAYAEAGRFADAVDTAQRAMALATAAGQKEVVTRNLELLEFYRAGKPYHEPAK